MPPSREERDRAVRQLDPEHRLEERIGYARREMNALAPSKDVADHFNLERGESWLSERQRFMAGCNEIGGTVTDSAGNPIHKSSMDNTKVNIEGAEDSLDRIQDDMMFCHTDKAVIGAKLHENNRDSILMTKVDGVGGSNEVVNPSIDAMMDLPNIDIGGSLSAENSYGSSFQVTEEGVEEMDRSSERPEKQAEDKKFEFKVRRARSDLDRGIREVKTKVDF